MKKTMIQGSVTTIFAAAAAALAFGSVSSPAYADGDTKVSAGVSGACSAGGECVVIALVKAGDGLHVNTEYNHKATVNDSSGVTFLGKSTPNLFSKNDGDFSPKGEKYGMIKIRFKPAAKGKVTIAGTYKYATCKEGAGGGCSPGSGGFSTTVEVK
jgi:hypothetical protein